MYLCIYLPLLRLIIFLTYNTIIDQFINKVVFGEIFFEKIEVEIDKMKVEIEKIEIELINKKLN